MPIRPDDKEHIARALGDTGVFARDLLGYNYDEVAGGQRINVGTGGIRDSGKTREIIQLLDDAGIRYKLVMVPRDCRKSTMAQALCLRRISENPNIRIFYVGRTDDIVRGKSLAIRAQLLRPEIETLFGPQQGDKWEEMEWTVAGRNMPGLMNATFTAFSQDSLPTGGRCDLLILDDFIDHTNVATPEQNKKSKERWKLLVPFISSGSEVIIFCTLWADDDLNSELRANRLFQPPTGGQVVCGAGVRVVHDGLGGLDLEITEGGLTFPHLTLEYLREKLHLMALAGDYRQFVRQYLNETASLGGTGFYRQDFQPLKWENDMESLSGYLLTDTAIGKSDDSCFSVLAYVGLDQADHIYLLDLEIGHWDPTMFRNKFFDMLEAWKGKVNHCGECWEKVQLATAYRDAIEQDSRARKLKLHTIEMPRPAKSHKMDRIKRLQHPMRNKKFWVVDTISKTFIDSAGERVLWNPTGFYDAQSQKFLPSGELVDEIIRESSKKDIPDTLAMILEWTNDRRGAKRYCTYKAMRQKAPAVSLTQQRRDDYHRREYGPPESGDWFEKTLRDLGI